MLQLHMGNLYRILRDFHTLTKIRIVIFDAQFQELLAYPSDREAFCTQLRQTPKGEAACQCSDMHGCRLCAETKEVAIYTCHAGLTEAVVPIFDKNSVLAYVMFGQILTKETSKATTQNLKQTFPELKHTVDQLIIKSEEELNAAATILQAITSMMMTNRWVTPARSDFIRQLDQYIEEHLSTMICVEDLCAAFHMGRTRLYDLSTRYLGCGLASYIRRQRIVHAQRLLKESSLSITEIAYAVGFSDYNHFSKIFRQITGVPARQYRQNE